MTKLKNISIGLLTIAVLAGSGSCKVKKESGSLVQKEDCPPGIMCTEEFRMITLKVNGNKLDEAFTVDQKSKKTVKVADDMSGDSYVVLDDTYVKTLLNGRGNFRFIGKINGKTVVDASFVISADCCHITKVSGPETVTAK